MKVALDLKRTQQRARKMDEDQLWFAVSDCHGSIAAMGATDMVGKDRDFYLLEMSVYVDELKSRK